MQFVGVTISMDYVLDYGFLLSVYHYMGQPCSWTIAFTIACSSITVIMFRTMVSSFSVYRCMWPRGSSRRYVQVLEETSQRAALEDRLKRAAHRLENHLTESISGILLDQSGEVVRILELTIFCGVWCSGTGSGDFVRLRNRTLPLDRCKFFQC